VAVALRDHFTQRRFPSPQALACGDKLSFSSTPLPLAPARFEVAYVFRAAAP